jgi:hypothetical protein
MKLVDQGQSQLGQRQPCGQRAANSASSHLSSLP